jgi:hypothetical protein
MFWSGALLSSPTDRWGAIACAPSGVSRLRANDYSRLRADSVILDLHVSGPRRQLLFTPWEMAVLFAAWGGLLAA